MKLIINSIVDETVKSSNTQLASGIVCFWIKSKVYMLSCVHQIYYFSCLNHPTNEKEIKYRTNHHQHSIDEAINEGLKVYYFENWEEFLMKETELPY